jgi:hypothetical protein
MAQVAHQYRLTDSVEYDSLQIAGVTLTKDWFSFVNVKEELQAFLKSTTNTEGMVDYQKVNVESKEVLYKTIPNPLDMPIFERNVLFSMIRSELCEICKEYGIVTTNKTNQFLVKEIIEKQENIEAAKIEQSKEIIPSETTNKIEDNTVAVEPEVKAKSVFDILKKK